MQLWQMLGRKTHNLGRVIDGERDASMGAKKAAPGAKVTGLSVQDELQSFFADTKVSEAKAPKVPVKGTIMSFFAKQQQKTPQSKDTRARKESSTKPLQSSQKPTIFGNPPKTSPQMIEWDCKACTFHNKKRRRNSGALPCEMCGTKYQEIIDIDDPDITSHKVTPASVRKGDLETSQQLRSSSVKKQTNPNIKASQPEIVMIDDVDEPHINVVPRKLDSTLANPIILCDETEESSSRKKRKLDHVQSRAKVTLTTFLSFSVSRNSGRITIHFSDTGESSLTNFKIEQIVNEETADRLMEARLSRNQKAMASIKLVYSQPALSKGKESETLTV